jgi:mono/diheme cytochrome c family protein
MSRILTLVALAAFAIAPAAGAQSVTVDQNLAKRGKMLFGNRGCAGCHTFGKKLAGPDLVGATARRDQDWLRRWLKAPDQMLESDSIAKAMLVEFQSVKMPNMKLSDADVDALVHYIQQESDKKKK